MSRHALRRATEVAALVAIGLLSTSVTYVLLVVIGR